MSTLRTYKFDAVDTHGVRVKGTRQATDEEVLGRALSAEGLTILSVDEQSTSGFNADLGVMFGGGGPRMKIADQAVFARGMAHMLGAGLSVPHALQVTADDAPDTYRQAILDVRDSVLQGNRLAESMAAFPGCFDDVFIGYVSVGEDSGELPSTFARLASQVERQNKVRLKVKSVTAYPKMVSGAITLMVFVILKFVVPQFAGIYASLGSSLPAPTQIVVKLSNLLSPFGVFHLPLVTLQLLSPLLFVPLFIAIMRRYKKARASFHESFLGLDENEEEVRKTWILKTLGLVLLTVGWNLFVWKIYDPMLRAALWENFFSGAGSGVSTISAMLLYQKPFQITLTSPVSWAITYVFYLRITDYIRFLTTHALTLRGLNKARFKTPIFGKLNYQLSLYRTIVTLAGGMRSGLKFSRAVRLAGQASGSALFSSACDDLSLNVEEGKRIGQSMDDYPELFPGQVRALVRAGEDSGDIPGMLDSASNAVDAEIEATVSSLGAKIEVGLLVLMGGVVGTLVIVLYMPIFQLANAATSNL